jgi:hypothetical protein
VAGIARQGPVAPIPSKARLLATLSLMRSTVEALPDDACEQIERSGLLSIWRGQLETIGRLSPALHAARKVAEGAKVVGDAVKLVRDTFRR